MRWAKQRLGSEEGREVERRRFAGQVRWTNHLRRLEDKRSEEEPHVGTPGRGIVEEGLARLDMLKYRTRVPVGIGPTGGRGGAECTANGEIPGARAVPRCRAGPRYRQGGRGHGQKGRVGRRTGEGLHRRWHGVAGGQASPWLEPGSSSHGRCCGPRPEWRCGRRRGHPHRGRRGRGRPAVLSLPA